MYFNKCVLYSRCTRYKSLNTNFIIILLFFKTRINRVLLWVMDLNVLAKNCASNFITENTLNYGRVSLFATTPKLCLLVRSIILAMVALMGNQTLFPVSWAFRAIMSEISLRVTYRLTKCVSNFAPKST